MSRISRTLSLMIVALAFSAALPAGASDAVGVYGVVDRVVVSPPGQPPGAVQIWGTFAVAVPPPGSSYAPSQAYSKPQKGYLLYTCPAGKTADCTAEWNDLKSVAGKNEVVGFSARWGYTNHLHAASDPAPSPDVYVLNVGVVRISASPSLGSAYKDLFELIGQAAGAGR